MLGILSEQDFLTTRNEHFRLALSLDQRFAHRMIVGNNEPMLRYDFLLYNWLSNGALILWWRHAMFNRCSHSSHDRLVYCIGPPDSASAKESNDHDRGARQNKPIGHPDATRKRLFVKAGAGAHARQK